METVEIYDRDYKYVSPVLGVHLKHVLSCINDEEKAYHWTMLEFYGGVGDLSPMTNILELEKQVLEAPYGVDFSWKDLEEIANKLEDALDIIVVANERKKINGSVDILDEYHRTNDITFELFDRCFWIVSSNSESLIQRIKNRFYDVKPSILRRVSRGYST